MEPNTENMQTNVNPAQEEPKNPSGTPSLVLGICSIVFSCGILGVIPGIIAIVLGNKNTQYDKKAKVGMILGIVGSVLSLISIVIWLLMGTAILAPLLVKNNVTANSNTNTYTTDWDDWMTEDLTAEPISTIEITENSTENSTEGSTEAAGNVVVTDIEGYTPEYGTMLIGSDEVGYTYVPDDFYVFSEIGGTGFDNSVQYGNGQMIVGLNSMQTEYSAYDMAQAFAQATYDNEAVDSTSIVLSTEEINGIYGYTMMAYYPADNCFLYTFVFDGTDGLVHYNSVEFPGDGYTDLWKTVFYNYYLN